MNATRVLETLCHGGPMPLDVAVAHGAGEDLVAIELAWRACRDQRALREVVGWVRPASRALEATAYSANCDGMHCPGWLGQPCAKCADRVRADVPFPGAALLT